MNDSKSAIGLAKTVLVSQIIIAAGAVMVSVGAHEPAGLTFMVAVVAQILAAVTAIRLIAAQSSEKVE